jgi:hypothetical protein
LLFVILQVTGIISLYINVNSGGLESVSGTIFLYCFSGLMIFLYLSIILIPTCFVVSLIKIRKPKNILVTSIAVVIAAVSFRGEFYLRSKVIQHGLDPDAMRCVGYNLEKGKKLREFGLKLNQLNNDKDFTFTEQFLETNLVRDTPHLKNGVFALNSNVLNKKPSQLSDNVVVTFESTIPYGKGNIGGPNDVSTWWHYGKGSLMVFGDGRVEFVKTEDFNDLRWEP